MAYDPTANAGLGTDGLEESTSLPLINVIQQLSPQFNQDDEKYIEGSKVGDMFFAPTGQILQQPISFIPTAFRTMYVEWKPKDQGGGIVGTHPLSIVSSPDYKQGVKAQYDEWLNDNELKKTTYVLGFMDLDGTSTECMIAFVSTGQKVARLLQKNIRNFRYDGKFKDVPPAVFARSWDLTTVREKNAKGQSYYVMAFNNPKTLDFTKNEDILNLCADQAKHAVKTLPSVDSAPKPALEASDNY